MNMPIAEPYSINDGYGIVGTGFICGACGKGTNWVIIEKGEDIECENDGCRAINHCNETYDF